MNQTEFSNLEKNKYYQNLVTQINENKKETNTNSTEFSLSSLFPFFFILKTYFNLIKKKANDLSELLKYNENRYITNSETKNSGDNSIYNQSIYYKFYNFKNQLDTNYKIKNKGKNIFQEGKIINSKNKNNIIKFIKSFYDSNISIYFKNEKESIEFSIAGKTDFTTNEFLKKKNVLNKKNNLIINYCFKKFLFLLLINSCKITINNGYKIILNNIKIKINFPKNERYGNYLNTYIGKYLNKFIEKKYNFNQIIKDILIKVYKFIYTNEIRKIDNLILSWSIIKKELNKWKEETRVIYYVEDNIMDDYIYNLEKEKIEQSEFYSEYENNIDCPVEEESF